MGPKQVVEDSGVAMKDVAETPIDRNITTMTTSPNITNTNVNVTTSTRNLSFIITGFGPFGGVEENPTTTIVEKLDSYLRSSNGKNGCNDDDISIENINNNVLLANLVKEYVMLETSVQDVCKTMDRIKQNYTIAATAAASTTDTNIKNDNNRNLKVRKNRIILLHLGVARTSSFRLESCAYNEANFRIPDQQGYKPKNLPIVSLPDHELGKCYKTSLNLKKLHQTLINQFPQIPVEISNDPGRFVCNYVYCKSLQLSSLSSSPSSPNLEPETDDNNDNITDHVCDENNTVANNNNDDIEYDDENEVICSSLFFHVPHFSVVAEEDQLAYVACLLRALAA